MTTATTTKTSAAQQVPVPTELAKTVLGITFGSALDAQLDPVTMSMNPGEIGESDSFIANGADDVISEYLTDMQRFHDAETLLLSLRGLKPGKDATITVPDDLGLLEMLDSTIESLAENKVSVHGSITQRQVAEATIAAIDLQETIAQLREAAAGAGA
jgi:hypothetical protein